MLVAVTVSSRASPVSLCASAATGCSQRYVVRSLIKDYLLKSQDPLVPNTWAPRYAWFRMSLFSEFVLQVPAFVLGLYAFWTGVYDQLSSYSR